MHVTIDTSAELYRHAQALRIIRWIESQGTDEELRRLHDQAGRIIPDAQDIEAARRNGTPEVKTLKLKVAPPNAK